MEEKLEILKYKKTLLIRTRNLLSNSECDKNFMKELAQKLEHYERTKCIDDEDSDDGWLGMTVPPTGATRRGGANKSRYKKLKRRSNKTKKIKGKRFRSRRNKSYIN